MSTILKTLTRANINLGTASTCTYVCMCSTTSVIKDNVSSTTALLLNVSTDGHAIGETTSELHRQIVDYFTLVTLPITCVHSHRTMYMVYMY